MEKINITMGNKVYRMDKFSTIIEFIEAFMPEEKYNYYLAFINGKLSELSLLLVDDCLLEFVPLDVSMSVDTYKRSLTLLMVKAFSDVLGSKTDHRVSVMYSVGKGKYCELISDKYKLTTEILEKVKSRMHELVELDEPIIKESVGTDEAISRFVKQGMTDKEKLFRYRRVSKANLYSMGGYEDYYYGYMLPSASYIKYFDLLPYKDGFVLISPTKNKPKELPEYQAQDKLFNVLKTSSEWGNMMDIDGVSDLNEIISTGEINDIILVQEALQEKQIAQIADMIKLGQKRIVLIAGPSSSGKTTFSHRLSVQLRAHGIKPYPLALDNYFVDREFTPRDENGKFDFECIEAMDLDLFNSDMAKLLAGEEITMPTFNFIEGYKEYKGNKMKLNKGDVLVAEGIHALNPVMTEKLPDDSKFKIYISALTQLSVDNHNYISTTDGRLIRRIVRDARTRGNDARGTIEMWDSVRRGEEKYIFPFQEEADVMFNSALIYELSVIKQYAEPLLFGVPRDCPEFQEAKRLLKFLDYFLGLEVTNVPKNSILREFVGAGCFDL